MNTGISDLGFKVSGLIRSNNRKSNDNIKTTISIMMVLLIKKSSNSDNSNNTIMIILIIRTIGFKNFWAFLNACPLLLFI